jgi:hypothetical protein
MAMQKDSYLNFVYTWKETYELSFELADVTFTILNEVVEYCKIHNIPIIEQEGLWNLVTKARSIFANLEEVNSPKVNMANINRRFLTDTFKKNKTDGDLTEPKSAILIKSTERLHVATS